MHDIAGAFVPLRAILVHVYHSDESESKREYMREELKSLAHTAGVDMVGELFQSMVKDHAKTLIGKGKLEELADFAKAESATLIIFGIELSGSQLRNVEDVCMIRVIDRTQLILDIFASRAKSFEGKAQVRLAELQYALPRLMGQGVTMSRLGAGIGTRGPGETKLEIDRRTIRKDIAKLRRIVIEAGVKRAELRRRRRRLGVYSVGLIGYTNAGKTTLLAHLAKRYGEKQVEPGNDRLFDTLDPTSRRVMYASQTLVVTDTVGFIRELPHHLIDAFRATLEEALDSDVLIHVIDASSPYREEEMKTVYDVVHGVLKTKVPVISVFNKMDLLPDSQDVEFQDHTADQVIRGSILLQDTLAQILSAIDHVVLKRVTLHLQIPSKRSDILAEAYLLGEVSSCHEKDDHLYVDVAIDEKEISHFVDFLSDRDIVVEDQWL